MRRILTSLLVLCALARAVHGQTAADTKVLTAQPYLSLDKLAVNAPFKLAVVIDLNKPWHVNANPATLEGFIPTTLTVQPSAGIVIDHITYPPGQKTPVSWADQPVDLYMDHAVILAEGHVAADAPRGPVTINASLRYQACNDNVCRAPVSLPLSLAGEIVGPDQQPQPAHPEIFAAAAPAPADANLVARWVHQRGWVIAFILVFLGGLALNLTPCVYPMIAITVSYFGGQSDRSKSNAFAHALTYCAGIVVTYSTVGLVAALTGGLFGSLLENPVVLVTVALLMVALALSMFGLYELQPPQFLMQRATGLSSKAGYLGVFFLGAVVGVIAAPCVGPILVALLAFVSQRGDPWLGWWLFFTLAVGLGLPYVVLGTFSGLLPRLPKSGTWMVRVKLVFGVILIGVAVWFVLPLFHSRQHAPSPIAWQPYSKELLAHNAGKPALIDFAADWCIPCKEMIEKTYLDPRIVAKSKSFLMLQADLTQSGSPGVDALMHEFKIVGVPTMVFIGPEGSERADLRKVGFVSADELLATMDQALAPAPTNSGPAAASAPDVPPQLMRPF
jgi:thiol:disulfide interchange protein DsbD